MIGKNIVIRLIGLLTFLALLAWSIFVSTAYAQITGSIPPTPALKRQVTVTNEIVRIGDMVENAGETANIPIFRSPDLGQTGAVPASRVIDAIRAHGILLVDTKGVSEIVVSRPSRVFTLKDIEAQVARAIAEQYGYTDSKALRVSFDREVRPIQAEPSANADLAVARLFHDPRTGRFDVSFEFPGDVGARHGSLRLTGTIVETVETAVLTRPFARGEVVKASDVTTERRPKAEVGSDLVGTAAQAIGLAARQPLKAGQPLRSADLMRPEIVQRNEAVTLIYEAPGMMLTMRGKALDSGAEGDVVNVLNLQSKRNVQGIVSGPGRITVTGTTQRIPPSVASAPEAQATDVIP